MIVLLLPLAFAPALFWMWWYYRQDLYEKEPKRLLALVFLLAMPFSVLTGLVEYTVDGGNGRFSTNSNFLISSLFYIFIVGILEELAKFCVVLTLAYNNKEFNEPVDGIIYTAAVALGFASFENIFYLLDQGPLIILLRGPVSTLGHVLFSAMWGAALGLARFEPNRAVRIRMICWGFFWAVLTHSLFDILISLGRFQDWLALSGVPFLAVLYWLVARRIAYALDLSQFKPQNPAQLLKNLGPAAQRLLPSRVHAQPTSKKPDPVYVPNPNSYRFSRNPNPKIITNDENSEDTMPKTNTPEINNSDSNLL
jgi:RsiW-degrading membrane proteinase PrsW (M82 family)